MTQKKKNIIGALLGAAKKNYDDIDIEIIQTTSQLMLYGRVITDEEILWSDRGGLIWKRNALLEKPFYHLRFWLHGKVAKLDAEIDAIDLKLRESEKHCEFC